MLVVNTEEVFRIRYIDKRRQPYLYKLQDLTNQDIIGSFYAQELIPTKLKSVYPIKILKKHLNKKTGKTTYLVTYLNWPKQFDEWIDEKQIINYEKI